jgi:hypothetical protein
MSRSLVDNVHRKRDRRKLTVRCGKCITRFEISCRDVGKETYSGREEEGERVWKREREGEGERRAKEKGKWRVM